MVRYMDKKSGPLDARERDKLLFWFAQAGMWGRFSGSTETVVDQDLAALEGPKGGLDVLIEQLRLWRGSLRVEPDHFTGWSLGARFYPVLYMLTRMGDALDWGTGLPLKANLLGKMNRLDTTSFGYNLGDGKWPARRLTGNEPRESAQVPGPTRWRTTDRLERLEGYT